MATPIAIVTEAPSQRMKLVKRECLRLLDAVFWVRGKDGLNASGELEQGDALPEGPLAKSAGLRPGKPVGAQAPNRLTQAYKVTNVRAPPSAEDEAQMMSEELMTEEMEIPIIPE